MVYDMFTLNSKVTKKLLGYFYLHEHQSLYVNEMERQFGVDKRNLVKKLRELSAQGILVNEKKGKEIYYALNKKYPLFAEYRKIILKTYGIENDIKEILRRVKGIEEAYIFGSYAKNKMDAHSDIDVLVIGDADTLVLQKKVAALQSGLEREINLVNIDRNDLNKRVAGKDPFITEIMRGDKIKLI